MKKIFILLFSLLLLVGCVESIALLGGSATNGKLVQSSLKSVASYGVKKQTGKTPLQHFLSQNKEKKILKKEDCSSFINKKESEICKMVKKRIISKQIEIKEKFFLNKPLKKTTLSLQSSINEKSKIKYLD